jgi:hypothetical protein
MARTCARPLGSACAYRALSLRSADSLVARRSLTKAAERYASRVGLALELHP